MLRRSLIYVKTGVSRSRYSGGILSANSNIFLCISPGFVSGFVIVNLKIKPHRYLRPMRFYYSFNSIYFSNEEIEEQLWMEKRICIILSILNPNNLHCGYSEDKTSNRIIFPHYYWVCFKVILIKARLDCTKI